MLIIDAEKTLTRSLAKIAKLHRDLTGKSDANTSKAVLNDGSALKNVLTGTRQITPRQYDRLVSHMLENLKSRDDWPAIEKKLSLKIEDEPVPDLPKVCVEEPENGPRMVMLG